MSPASDRPEPDLRFAFGLKLTEKPEPFPLEIGTPPIGSFLVNHDAARPTRDLQNPFVGCRFAQRGHGHLHGTGCREDFGLHPVAAEPRFQGLCRSVD